MTKAEIEIELQKKGDYVKIDYLTRLLEEKQLPIDRKKFVWLKLAEIYEQKGMLIEAGKMYNNIAVNSIILNDKTQNHIKEAEMYVKGGAFEYVDEAVRKALAEAHGSERVDIQNKVRDFYKKQAEFYEKQKKRSNAMKVYEKLLQTNISNDEKQEINVKLMSLYEQLGKVKEYFNLKSGVSEQKKKDEKPKSARKTLADLGIERY